MGGFELDDGIELTVMTGCSPTGERATGALPGPRTDYPTTRKACLRSYFATLRPRTTPATPENG
jgi:hypothetical protein